MHEIIIPLGGLNSLTAVNIHQSGATNEQL